MPRTRRPQSPAELDVRGHSRTHRSRLELRETDRELLNATVGAALSGDNRELARLEFLWAVRAGLDSRLRCDQLLAMSHRRVRLDPALFELPSDRQLASEGPLHRLCMHPLGEVLALRREILFDLQATVPEGCEERYFAAESGSSPELTELRALVPLEFGEMAGILRQVRRGDQSQNALPFCEWICLPDLEGATDAEVSGLVPSGVGPDGPPEKHRSRAPAASALGEIAEAIADVIGRTWRSAVSQQWHRDTRAETAGALRKRACQELGLVAQADYTDDEILRTVGLFWSRRIRPAATAVHLMFLVAELEKTGYRPQTFAARYRALCALAAIGQRGVADADRGHISELMRDQSSTSKAAQIGACASLYGAWVIQMGKEGVAIPQPQWAGYSFPTVKVGKIVSLLWPRWLHELRGQVDHDTRQFLDDLIATGSRVEALRWAQPRAAVLTGETPYIDLWQKVKGGGSQRVYIETTASQLQRMAERVRELPPEGPLEVITTDQLRGRMRLHGRTLHPHDIRRLLAVRLVLGSAPGASEGEHWLGRLWGRFNWRSRQTMLSYAVCVDYLGNRAAAELMSGAQTWRLTPLDARALSGLPAAVARRAFSLTSTPDVAAISQAQRGYLANSKRNDRCRRLAVELRTGPLREVVSGVRDAIIGLDWLGVDDRVVLSGAMVTDASGLSRKATRALLRAQGTSGRRAHLALVAADGGFSRWALRELSRRRPRLLGPDLVVY